MAVITVSRQYGSGGSAVARLVAEALSWTLIDNDFVDRVAERAGVPRDLVAEQEERAPSLLDRLARALARTSPDVVLAGADVPPPSPVDAEASLVRITQAVIGEAVQHGDVVLVGRGAQAHLAERHDVFHVFVAAPRDVRVNAVVERLGMSLKDAEHAVNETDANRVRYVKTHYGRVWGNPADYHLVVNTAFLGCEGAAAVVVGAARRVLGVPEA